MKNIRLKSVILFLVALLGALGLTYLLRETSFTPAQTSVLFLLLFSVALWLTEAVPPFSVGILIIGFLAFSLGYEKFTDTPVDVSMYTQTLSSSVIWLMLGGFFLAAAMTKTRIDELLVTLVLSICGKNPRNVLLGMMIVTMVASMLISNTATTSMVITAIMPLLVKIGKNSPASKALILGIPIAATTGGMGTLIGSPPNAIAAGALANAGSAIDFTRWMTYGLPVSVLLTLISWYVLTRVLIKESKLKLMGTRSDGKHDLPVSPVQRWVVTLILAATVFLWLTSPWHHLSTSAVAALPLVVLPLAGIITGEDIRSMGWDTLLLVAGGLALGKALQETGLMDLYGSRIAAAQLSDTLFYLMLAYATMFFSNIMSNTATCTVLIPLGMAILPHQPIEVAMIIGLSASTALLLPVSTPPNAIAFSSGVIEQKDLRIGGILIGLLGPALIVAWVLLLS